MRAISHFVSDITGSMYSMPHEPQQFVIFTVAGYFTMKVNSKTSSVFSSVRRTRKRPKETENVRKKSKRNKRNCRRRKRSASGKRKRNFARRKCQKVEASILVNLCQKFVRKTLSCRSLSQSVSILSRTVVSSS